MSEPIRYSAALPAAVGPCGICGDADALMLNDHCHEHGWLRGTLCQSCNIKLGHAEARGMVGERLILADALAWLTRCPDCVPELAAWTETARPAYASIRVTANVAPQLRRLVRHLAAHVDRHVTQSEALSAAIALARADLPGTAEMLDAPTSPPAADGGGAALSDLPALANSESE